MTRVTPAQQWIQLPSGLEGDHRLGAKRLSGCSSAGSGGVGMSKGTAAVDRFGARRLFILSGVILGLLAPASASATITSVFGGTVTCTTQSAVGEEGQRWCGNTAGTTVKTW